MTEAIERHEAKDLIEHACNDAMDAALARLGDNATPETVVFVVIENIDPPEGEMNDCVAARKRDAPATVQELLTTLLYQSTILAKMIGKDLKLIPVEQHSPEQN